MKALTSPFSVAIDYLPVIISHIVRPALTCTSRMTGYIDVSYFCWRIGRINELLYFFAGTVSTYDTSEFFDVVAAQCEHWLPGLFVELRSAELIGGWAM